MDRSYAKQSDLLLWQEHNNKFNSSNNNDTNTQKAKEKNIKSVLYNHVYY